MNVRSWIGESIDNVRTDGLAGAIESLRPVKHKVLSAGNVFYPQGTSIYEREWDLLIVLDACRYDLFLEVANEYEWINEVEEIRSLDSTTAFWMRRTFTESREVEMQNTAYICGNPFSAEELNAEDFAELLELWKYVWVDPGTVPPEAITDETIRIMRDETYDRVIAHYMQPHCPFLSRPNLSKGKDIRAFGNQDWPDVWERLREGEINEKKVWKAYQQNLKLGLSEVEVLLRNVDAEKVIITSDHGNAKGEWGVYGHPPSLPMNSLRNVPWIQTKGEDKKTRELENWKHTQTGFEREDQLHHLGYV